MKETAAEHRKFIRQERVKQDRQQTVFFKTEHEVTFTNNPNKWATLTNQGLDPYRNVTCIFCLGISKLRLFLISTKKGYNRSLGKCPVCGQKMRLETLVKMLKWTPEEYAKFVFDYRQSGFWQKVAFEDWKKRLDMMGWSQPFWTEYKRLRGDPENYAEYEQSFKETVEA